MILHRHHAQKSQASGFCYVADCVLAILTLKRARIPSTLNLDNPNPPLRKPRILYLDLDLHFSDGVSHAFHNIPGTPQILTLSLHHAAPGFFPISSLSSLPPSNPDPTFDPFTLSIPLARGANCQTFFSIWTNCVERVRASFQPDFVVLQCGVDGLAGDTYGIWNWSLGGREDREDEEGPEEGSLGWCVNRVCHSWGCKTLLLGGGKLLKVLSLPFSPLFTIRFTLHRWLQFPERCSRLGVSHLNSGKFTLLPKMLSLISFRLFQIRVLKIILNLVFLSFECS